MSNIEILAENAIFVAENEHRLVTRVNGLPPRIHELRRADRIAKSDTFVYPLGPAESALYNLDRAWMRHPEYQVLKNLLFLDNSSGSKVNSLRVWLIEGLISSNCFKASHVERLEEKLMLEAGMDFFPEEKTELVAAALCRFGSIAHQHKIPEPSESQVRGWLRGEVACPRYEFVTPLYTINPKFEEWKEHIEDIKFYRTIRSAARRFIERPTAEQESYVERVGSSYGPKDVRYWLLETFRMINSLHETAYGYAMAIDVSKKGNPFSGNSQYSHLPVISIGDGSKLTGKIEEKLGLRAKNASELWKDHLVVDGMASLSVRLYAAHLAGRLGLPKDAVYEAATTTKIKFSKNALIMTDLPDEFRERVKELDCMEREIKYEKFSDSICRGVENGGLDDFFKMPAGTIRKGIEYDDAIQRRIPQQMRESWAYDQLIKILEEKGEGRSLIKTLSDYRRRSRIKCIKSYGDIPSIEKRGLSDFSRIEISERLRHYGLDAYTRAGLINCALREMTKEILFFYLPYNIGKL